MTFATVLIVTIALAYLIGGIPFGYLIARWKGVDIFQHGSGNIGATNVGRVLGRTWGIVCFGTDFLKGALPVLLATLLPRFLSDTPSAEELGVAAGLSAIVGHMFSIYLKFKGGKGVATAAGVVFLLFPIAASVSLLTWAVVVLLSRYVSLASLAAAVALCLVRGWQTWPDTFSRANVTASIFCLVVAFLVFLRHRSNITRLLRGQENRLKDGHTMQNAAKILHVLAMGLWFGMLIFFSFFVALTLFNYFEAVGMASQRPSWFPLPEMYSVETDLVKGPKEQGSRAAGYVISPLFTYFFMLQGVFGFLALATCFGWQYRFPAQKVHGRRVTILMLGLVTVLVGWPLEVYVSQLRVPRNAETENYLQAVADGKEDVSALEAKARDARGTFIVWHLVSLFLNFDTVLFVTIGMAMAAFLPPTMQNSASNNESGHAPPPETQTGDGEEEQTVRMTVDQLKGSQ